MELLGTGFFSVAVRFHLIQVLENKQKIFFTDTYPIEFLMLC